MLSNDAGTERRGSKSAEPAPQEQCDPPEVSPQQHLRNQLAAVRLLTTRSDRDIAHHDILIASVLEALEDGPLPVTTVKRRVAVTWPSLCLPEQQWDAALSAAERIRHISAATERGTAFIELLEPGRISLSESKQYARDCLDRFNAQLADELLQRGSYTTAGDVEALGGLVISALRCVISETIGTAATAPVGELGGWLRVNLINLGRLDEFVDQRVFDHDRGALIKALVRVCLDQSNEIGNEIVHQIIKGHLLYAFMARPDLVAAVDVAGPLRGEKLIVDTPLLVRMLAGRTASQPVLALLTSALALGMDVLLYQRTCDELNRVLDRAGHEDAGVIDEALRSGADPELLASLSRGNQITSAWLGWAVTQPRGKRSWDDWRASPAGDGAALRTLAAIGIRPYADEGGLNLLCAGRLTDFESRLAAQIEQQGARRRNEHVIKHDALNLLDVWRAREKNPATAAKVWPGGFVVTPDGQLNETFEAVLGEQTFPAAITFTQCAEIIGRYSVAGASEELATAIAPGIADQMLIGRSAPIPSEAIRDMAQALGADPVSASEAEELRSELRAMFGTGRDRLEPGSADHLETVAALSERIRARRTASAREALKWSNDERRRRELLDARRAQNDTALRDRIALLEAKSEDITGENERLARAALETREKHAEELDSVRREHWVSNGVWIGCLLAVLLGLTAHYLSAVIVLVMSLSLWAYGRDWARRKMNLRLLSLNIAIAVTTIAPYVTEWIRRR